MKNIRKIDALIVVIFSFIIAIPLFVLNLYSFAGGILVAGLLFDYFMLGFGLNDLLLILIPFMFYMDIGGAVNTSLADFILVLWLFFSIRGGKSDILLLENTSCKITQQYMINYGKIFLIIMCLSLVNLIRWEKPLFLSAIISIFKIFICILYSMFTLYYLDKYGRRRFLMIMAYSTLFFDLLMIVGVAAYTRGIDLGLTFAGTFRATGTFEDPNLAAAYLFLMVSFAIVYFSEEKKYFLLGISILLTFVSVVLTSSKGTLVAVIVGLAAILIVSLMRRNIKIVMKLIISYAMIAALLYYLYQHSAFVQQVCEPIFNRFEEFTSNVEGDHSLAHREFLWKTAFDLGMTEPILGIGVEQFRPAATQYTGQNVWNIVHNTYLTFFCELGIVGLVAFFRIWIKNAWNHFMLMRRKSSSVFYLFSMICASISMWSISLGNFRTLWVFITFLLYEYYREVYGEEENDISSNATDDYEELSLIRREHEV